MVTREPGGSDGAEAIRELILSGGADRWDATSEFFLFMAARHVHLSQTVRPALTRGSTVISDRYADSTRVYQGVAGGLGLERIDQEHDRWLAPWRPELTFVLDLPVADGLERARARGEVSRFEAKSPRFHEHVREGFLELAKLDPERIQVVDATQTKEEVAETIRLIVEKRIADRRG